MRKQPLLKILAANSSGGRTALQLAKRHARPVREARLRLIHFLSAYPGPFGRASFMCCSVLHGFVPDMLDMLAGLFADRQWKIY